MNIRELPDHVIYTEYVRRINCQSKPSGIISLLGLPGSGKTIQAKNLADELCWCHISPKDISHLPSHKVIIPDDQKEAEKSSDYTDRVIETIEERMKRSDCKRGIVFDSFPRTLEEAEGLDELLKNEKKKIEKVFEFKINENLLRARVLGRRIHEPSGRSYNVFSKPPKVEGLDDITGQSLTHFDEDFEEGFKTRLEEYKKNLPPVLKYYMNQRKLFGINVDHEPKPIFNNIKKSI